MQGGRRQSRVTLIGNFLAGSREEVQAVLSYSQQIGNWRFVGKGTVPFTPADMLSEIAFDGAIVKELNRETVAAIRAAKVPVVSITDADEWAELPRATDDNLAIGRMGAEYLLERGFSELAFFGLAEEEQPRLRCEEFSLAIQDAGRTCHVRMQHGDSGSSISARLEGWLEELPKPIAIMCENDYLARLTVNVANNIGLRVPDDVAVLGVGDNPWMSTLAATPLSSIQLDRRRVGRVAAEMLDGLMAGGALPAVRTVPPIGVVTRNSTDIMHMEDRIVAEALAFIRDQCTRKINVEDILDHLGPEVARRTLEKRMRQALGVSPAVAISRARVEKAKSMLADIDTPIEAIARACGFSHPARLSETFKRLTGISPGEYRRQRFRR